MVNNYSCDPVLLSVLKDIPTSVLFKEGSLGSLLFKILNICSSNNKVEGIN